jgi:hypothetical protein
VHGRDVTTDELDVRVGHDLKVAMREDPARDVVGPLPLGRVLALELVVEDPLVGRRAHRQSADLGDEVAVVPVPLLVPPAREQPVERVVRIGDEAVERRRGVVLGKAHG